jgi:phosphoglycolate phosphatase-like HAD superfamily hydrolase
VGSPRLHEVLERAAATASLGRLPVVVFDLDYTILRAERRKLRILKEFSETHRERWPHLADLVERLLEADIGWEIQAPLVRRGVDDPEIVKALRKFWFRRHFTDEYAELDTPVPGAAGFVRSCHGRGAMVYYLTGRHVGGMEIGTVRNLLAHGFPLFDGRTLLHMKPRPEIDDHAFKAAALGPLRSLDGEIVASFENEPANANLFVEAFPEALNFFLTTVHSGRPDAPHGHLIRTDDFLLP